MFFVFYKVSLITDAISSKVLGSVSGPQENLATLLASSSLAPMAVRTWLGVNASDVHAEPVESSATSLKIMIRASAVRPPNAMERVLGRHLSS